MKNYFIKTYGCQMNEHDSKIISATLENLGYTATPILEDADVFIINSCSVRQAAEDSVYGWGKRIKKLNKKPLVILCGCLAGSATGERSRITEKYIKDKAPWIDVLLAPDELTNLPIVLSLRPRQTREAISDKTRLLRPDCNIGARNDTSSEIKHAFITISTGCDNFCSYCVVPYARKQEKSRKEEEIIAEISQRILEGVSNFTLLGQNVNSWGLKREEKFKIRAGSTTKLPFALLLRKICALDGVFCVDFLSSNPFDFTTDLIEAIKNPKIIRYLHIAVQSGDNEILAKMNRRHTREEFIDLVAKIRLEVPDMKIGTDIIVGFPGETEIQFQNTLEMCKNLKFEKIYISMYSPRPGTVAALMKNEVPLEVKRRRHKELLSFVKGRAGTNF